MRRKDTPGADGRGGPSRHTPPRRQAMATVPQAVSLCVRPLGGLRKTASGPGALGPP